MLHSKFVLRKKGDEAGEVENDKTKLVVCSNKEVRNEDRSSPVPDFTIIRIVMYLVIQRNWSVRHHDLQNVFPKGRLVWRVHNEM